MIAVQPEVVAGGTFFTPEINAAPYIIFIAYRGYT
jgi:hypothetical protein